MRVAWWQADHLSMLQPRRDTLRLYWSCALHSTPFTPHPTPYTLHPTTFTLLHKPCTLRPTPYTLHPTSYTLHQTRVPPPHTLPTPNAAEVILAHPEYIQDTLIPEHIRT